MEFHPLTPDRWSDFEELFGPRVRTVAAGACGGDYLARILRINRVSVIARQ